VHAQIGLLLHEGVIPTVVPGGPRAGLGEHAAMPPCFAASCLAGAGAIDASVFFQLLPGLRQAALPGVRLAPAAGEDGTSLVPPHAAIGTGPGRKLRFAAFPAAGYSVPIEQPALLNGAVPAFPRRH
jgi:hypothetical protein